MPETRDSTTQLGTYFSIYCQLDKLRTVNHNTTTQPPAALTPAAPRHILNTTSGSSSVVEHLLPKQRVASSILVSRSN